VHGKTRQIAADKAKGGKAEIDPSVIADLFSNRFSVSKKLPPHEKKAEGEKNKDEKGEKTEQLGIPATSTELQQALDLGLQPSDVESGKFVQLKGKRERRRIIIWSAVLALFLSLLFNMGSESPEKDKYRADISSSMGTFEEPYLLDEKTRKERARLLLEEGDRLYAYDGALYYLRAFDVYRLAVKYDPGDPVILGKLAQATARVYSQSNAKEQIERSLQDTLIKARLLDPQSTQLYRAEAILALNQDDLEKARQDILNAIETDPTGPENALLLGEISYALRDLDSAKQAFDEALKGKSNSPRALYFLAEVNFDLGDFAAARELALKVLKLNPFHPRAYLILGEVASSQNQLEKSKSYYVSAARLVRFDSHEVAVRAYLRLANLQEVLGEGTAAEKSYLLAYYHSETKDLELKRTSRAADT